MTSTHPPVSGFELSPQQNRLYLQQEYGAFANQYVLRLQGTLSDDTEALYRTAFEALTQRHEILRTTYRRQAGMKLPIQVIHDDLSPVWSRQDLSTQNGEKQTQAIDTFLREERAKAAPDFSAVQEAGSFRLGILTLDTNEHLLAITLPALSADAATLRNLVTEWVEALSGTESESEAPLQYADFSEWQREIQESEEDEAQEGRQFWLAQSATEALPLALPMERRVDGAGNAAQEVLPLDTTLSRRIKTLAEQQNAQNAQVVLAAWQSLLFRWTGQNAFSVGAAMDGRSDPELAAGMGLYARVLPLQVQITAEQSFNQTIANTHAAWMQAASQQMFSPNSPGKQEAQETGIGFAVEEWLAPTAVSGISIALDTLFIASAPFAVELIYAQVGNGDRLAFRYDTGRFAQDDIRRLADTFTTLLESALSAPNSAIGDLEILSEAERQTILIDWNRTDAEFPQDACLHFLFEAQAEKTPERPAVACNGERLTYAELNARANQLAHYLREQGVGRDVPVGLCVERSVGMVVALLGVLKAGGAYVPLAGEHPGARLVQQLETTQSPVLLTEESLRSKFEGYKGHLLSLDTDAARTALDSEPTTNPEHINAPQDMVYVIHTSGSTGLPKGVANTHRGLINYTHFLCKTLELDSEASQSGLHFATVTTLSADLGNTCVFPSLVSGGCLHVIPYGMSVDSTQFAAYARRNPLDVLKITPSHLAALLASPESAPILPHRWLVLGGEASSWEFIGQIRRLTPTSCRLLNHYGPTETTIGSLTYPIGLNADEETRTRTVPIGRPIANTRLFVVDPNRNLVPVGVAGELLIGGAGVARGYLNQPEQTSEKFLPNPFPTTDFDEAQRVYCTGDLVRRLPDGNVEFLGRADDQVKIRGFRVEPAEIENLLCRHPHVAQAVVLTAEDSTGDKRLVACFVPTSQAAQSQSHILAGAGLTETLREYLAEQTPEYMVPSAFLSVEALPLTANGKIDRSALLSLETGPKDVKTTTEVIDTSVPMTATEAALAHMWEEILGLENIGAHDDFFGLGGYSLKAIQVMARVREEFNVSLPMSTLFDSPTVSAVARAIDAERGSSAESAGTEVDDLEGLMAELDDLSEEEIERLLAAESQS